MSIDNLPCANGIEIADVSGCGPSNPYDGSREFNIPSGWDPNPVVEDSQYRKKIHFMSDDREIAMRLEDDEEGYHWHYYKKGEDGFIIKVKNPAMTFEEFYWNPLKFKKEANGLIKSLKKKKEKSDT